MEKLTAIFTLIVDFVFSLMPGKEIENPTEYKLVAHRGWHDSNVLENSMEAFQLALDNGVWGVEFDVRWTKDLVPVIHHDAECSRVWGRDFKICDITFKQLRKEIPEIPTLEEVVEAFGKKLHFFIELKWEDYPSPVEQNKILLFVLRNLTPGENFHFLSLNPKVYDFFTTLPKQYKFLVGTTNVKALGQIAIDQDFGGVMGHYLLLGKQQLGDHLRAGQKVGTGYVRSRKVLHREQKRGVEFFFTNHPWDLLDSVNQA